MAIFLILPLTLLRMSLVVSSVYLSLFVCTGSSVDATGGERQSRRCVIERETRRENTSISGEYCPSSPVLSPYTTFNPIEKKGNKKE